MRTARRGQGATAIAVVVAGLASACTSAPGAVPRCANVRRMALVAQAVPGAAYLPCVDHLEEGWRDERFTARQGRVAFRLLPGHDGGRPVRVVLDEACPSTKAVATRPRADGVRTSIGLRSISPRYTGFLIDEFAGGCVTYDFDFPRGPHIPLMEELQETVGLLARRDLRLDLRDDLSVELDP